jgi:ATP-dependent 26S proteasome regulatory subunit
MTLQPVTNATNAARQVPAWFETLRLRFGRGEAHTFLLHGLTSDFVYPGWPVARWLTRQFAGTADRPGRDVVLTVSLDTGITFPSVQMRRMFERTVGLQLSDDPDVRASQVAPGAPDDVPLPTAPSEMLAMVIDFLKRARRKSISDALLEARSAEERARLVEQRNRGVTEVDEPAVPGGARNAAAIIKRLDLIVPPGDKATLSEARLLMIQMLDEASTDTALEQAWNPLVLMSPSLSEVHADVVAAAGLRAIKVPLPDYEARLAFIRELQLLKPDLRLEMDPEQLAAITAGLSRRDIEDITLRAGDQPLTRTIALERQSELLDSRYGSVMRRLEPTFGYDALAGVDRLVDLYRAEVIPQLRTRDPDAPMGSLLMGPPGVAKTDFMLATAFEAGVNAIEMKNLESKWLGESQGNLELLFEGAEMFQPCIIKVDEFDKVFGSSESGDDHPVHAQMRKRTQEWMGDQRHAGVIHVMGATNYPDKCDPAMIREGRMDIRAAMLPPDAAEERAAIFAKLLERFNVPGRETVTPADLLALGEATPRRTGATLVAVVKKAKRSVKNRGVSLVEALQDAAHTINSAETADIRRQTAMAIDYCNDLSLLPDWARARRTRQQQPEAEPEPQDEPATPTVRRARREL